MQIRTVCPYSFGANTYIVYSGSEAFLVDPAVSVQAITSAVSDEGLFLKGILLTHGHFDHTVSIDTVRAALGIPLYVHERDAVMLTDGRKNAYYEFYGKECVHKPAERLLADNDKLRLGNEELTVIHTPGHSGGSVCYLADSFIITGDTLFAESVGRSDLWSGSGERLSASLEKLRTLPQSLKIYPGHGAPSTLGNALDNAAYYI